MSKLEKLIQELCPDGVQYAPLWTLTAWDKKFKSVEKHKQSKIKKYKYYLANELQQLESEEGTVKILTTNVSDLWANECDVKNDVINAEIVCIPWGGNPIVQYFNGKFITGDNRIATSLDTKVLDNKFLYYLLENNLDIIKSFYRGSGLKHPDMSKVLDMIIPVPPLEVQKEIVRLLDDFTAKTAELQTELNKEYEARKKQYEHYRDTLIKGDKNTPLIKLKDIGELQRGKRFVHADATESGVPCIHYGELYTYYGVYTKRIKSYIREDLRPKMRYANKEDVVIVGAGENNIDIGVGVAIDSEEPIAIHDACYIFKNHNQNSHYISYYLRTSFYHQQIKKYVSEGKICSISSTGIGNAEIPLPSIEVQNSIVNKLDNYELTFKELQSNISAEIESRQKQYEFYRDKLLTFKELS